MCVDISLPTDACLNVALFDVCVVARAEEAAVLRLRVVAVAGAARVAAGAGDGAVGPGRPQGPSSVH